MVSFASLVLEASGRWSQVTITTQSSFKAYKCPWRHMTLLQRFNTESTIYGIYVQDIKLAEIDRMYIAQSYRHGRRLCYKRNLYPCLS